MGYVGLPLAASITSIVISGVMLFVINKKIEGIVDLSTLKEFSKILISACLMGAILLLIKQLNINSTIINLVLSVIGGIIVYFVSILIIKSETTNEYIEVLKNKYLKQK